MGTLLPKLNLRTMATALAVVGLVGTSACGEPARVPVDASADAAPDGAADGGAVDGGDDGGTTPEPCSERDPRAVAPEAFIGPTGLAARLIAFFESATTTLRVAAYELDDARLVSALEAAHGRGVDVRVMVDADRDANTGPVATLRDAGVDVRFAPASFEHYHPKMIVVDEARAIVMSANLNSYSMETERNHGVVLDDAFDVADLVEVFDHDYEARPGEPAAAMCTRLVLSPHNARARILSLIAAAETRLSVQQLSLTDSEVRRAIGLRAMAGVETRVILADPAWITSNDEARTALIAMGVDVRILVTPENHAKLIIANDAAAFVGSENLSWTSLERNREVGVVVTAEATVAPLRAAFEDDWASAAP
ncbi:MAG: hypothetical protein JRH11_13715 [Deltaproteobacteria bacterium]|nr:hypothetical protein [Deltaproteobacteria bacterium]